MDTQIRFRYPDWQPGMIPYEELKKRWWWRRPEDIEKIRGGYGNLVRYYEEWWKVGGYANIHRRIWMPMFLYEMIARLFGADQDGVPYLDVIDAPYMVQEVNYPLGAALHECTYKNAFFGYWADYLKYCARDDESDYPAASWFKTAGWNEITARVCFGNEGSISTIFVNLTRTNSSIKKGIGDLLKKKPEVATREIKRWIRSDCKDLDRFLDECRSKINIQPKRKREVEAEGLNWHWLEALDGRGYYEGITGAILSDKERALRAEAIAFWRTFLKENWKGGAYRWLSDLESSWRCDAFDRDDPNRVFFPPRPLPK